MKNNDIEKAHHLTFEELKHSDHFSQVVKMVEGPMPEDLPTPDKSVKSIERSQKKLGGGK